MKFRAIELNNLDDDVILAIRDWRNQDFVRNNMLNNHIISESEHRNYIDLVREDSNRGLYVFFLDNQPFAVYQYSIDAEKREVTNGHYLISEEYQMLGYGAIMTYMEKVIEYYCLDVDYSYGCVLGTNKRQLNMNRKSNLVEIKEKELKVGEQYVDVYYYRNPISKPDPNTRLGKTVFMMVDDEPWTEMIKM